MRLGPKFKGVTVKCWFIFLFIFHDSSLFQNWAFHHDGPKIQLYQSPDYGPKIQLYPSPD